MEKRKRKRINQSDLIRSLEVQSKYQDSTNKLVSNKNVNCDIYQINSTAGASLQEIESKLQILATITEEHSKILGNIKENPSLVKIR